MKSQKKWLIFGVTWLASIVVAMNLSKVPPVMVHLLKDLKMDMVIGGWLMSGFSIATAVLCIPAAMILSKFGPKKTGIMALSCALLGTIVGAMAYNPAVMMAARILEGIGAGLIAVTATTIISMWFGPDERGLPMGMWALWVPLATVISFNAAQPIQAAMGTWRGIWWTWAVIIAIVLILYTIVVRAPQEHEKPKQESQPQYEDTGGPLLLRAVKNPALWFVGLAFLAAAGRNNGYNTWSPTYFTKVLTLSPSLSNFYASLPSLVMIAGSLFAGYLFDKVHNKKIILLITSLVIACLATQAFRLTPNWILIYMLLIGFAYGTIPATSFALTANLSKSPALIPSGMAITNLMSYLGMLSAPPIVGAAIQHSGWFMGDLMIVGFALLTVVAVVLLMILDSKKHQQQAPIFPKGHHEMRKTS